MRHADACALCSTHARFAILVHPSTAPAKGREKKEEGGQMHQDWQSVAVGASAWLAAGRTACNPPITGEMIGQCVGKL